jgi:hypothetical protein
MNLFTSTYGATIPIISAFLVKVFFEWKDFMARHGNPLLVTCGDWDLKTMLPYQIDMIEDQVRFEESE